MLAPAPDAFTGESERHLCSTDTAEALGARVNRDVVGAFRQLKHDAQLAGFDLRILSGFRSFGAQLSIWNRKATGRLAVLDHEARPIDIATLTHVELVFAILRWSALPGASRHHWGTDVDVFDEAARPEDYEVDLIPAEVNEGGMFGPLHGWLDARIAAGTASGFFRPYDRDRGGVAPERWHLSHAPSAAGFERLISAGLLRAAIEHADMALRETVLEHLDGIVDRFVLNTNRPTP